MLVDALRRSSISTLIRHRRRFLFNLRRAPLRRRRRRRRRPPGRA